MTDNSSEHTNKQHDNNLDLFDTGFTSEEMAPTAPPPHQRRNTVPVSYTHLTLPTN